MEHEVFVPVPAERFGEVFADPERTAGAVPGFQQDAGAEPGAGRLKVRVGGHSITYRGAFAVVRRDDGSYVIEGDATEVRGGGTVRIALTVRLRPAGGGTTLAFTGTAAATGRIAELPAETVASAGTRLLTRFAENAGGTAADTAAGPTKPQAPPRPAPVPVSAPVPVPAPEDAVAEPPVEAAHARRTMIGRSAEEVDHAPPRGRYAPVPAPEAVGSAEVLRWAAPAAAVVLASAIVMTRVLRRRR
ncbi:SRPBCC family protein [Streptomyces sp. B3I7]|uniref:SRPBCC family protein n=1 Tax=Streptomyces sp. B3I7 TaxID=3042269 RepID=UPI0027D7F6EB|nr:SRPBCC family protein [Streptomyces sp. B3I7]